VTLQEMVRGLLEGADEPMMPFGYRDVMRAAAAVLERLGDDKLAESFGAASGRVEQYRRRVMGET